ncbi:RNA binding protein [Mycena indigotica]|uniref:RNA binding protein n=1 Tax=Mycena indigotica TaxID=2126181 RepID=A0A8H6W6Q2_9AGAR|nr:RNA binding protein [Mycena indigotica]KAF7301329.1 RNA binding protein [Mycena indigotica]
MPPTLPPVNPNQTAAGIAVDPQTLERVIPESKRPDGSVRKQIKIRPGFTPQEDVRRFRGTKQTQHDANQLPKGHIIGWAPPPSSDKAGSDSAKPMSKSAKKNAKRRENKKKDAEVADNWDDDDDDTPDATSKASTAKSNSSPGVAHTPEKPNWAAAPEPDELSAEIDKLKVK